MSPPQQQLLNGPTTLGKNATNHAVSMHIASTHPMSTLKNIAQEVINRTSGGLESSPSPVAGSTLVQQQASQAGTQTQQQPPTVQQQPQPQPDTRQPGGQPVQSGQQQPGAQQQQPPQQTQPQQQPQQQQPFTLVDPANSANSLIPTSSSTAISNGPNAIINTSTSIVANTANPNVTSASMKVSGTNEAHIPPLLGVAPLGPSPLQKEHQIQVIITILARIHVWPGFH